MKIKLHMVGNAHIDPAWLWDYDEGRREVMRTYRAAADLIDEDADVIFTTGGSVTFDWVAQDDPALLDRIKVHVDSGRWCLVNGWWCEPDCNIPAAESFIHHGFYGQGLLERFFGRRARTGYNVDSFGHSAGLPSLLKGAGLDYYVFSRPHPNEKTLPGEVFWWEGPDGQRVLTARIPFSYGTRPDTLRERMDRVAAVCPPELGEILCFYGIGDHGGGPTRRDLAIIREVRADDSAGYEPVFSSPDRYFAAIEEKIAAGAALPVIKDELQHHARGCYSVLADLKRANRDAEGALLSEEALDLYVGASGDAAGSWKTALLHQFHDTMGGTCLEEVYADTVLPEMNAALKDIRARLSARLYAITQARLAREDDLRARMQDAEREGARILTVFNPHGFSVREPVEVRFRIGTWNADWHWEFRPDRVHVYDEDGKRVAAQVTKLEPSGGTHAITVTFFAEIDPLSSRLFTLRADPDSGPIAHFEEEPPAAIQNGWLVVEIDAETGWLTALKDIKWNYNQGEGISLIGGPSAVPLMLNDTSDTWSHDVERFDDVIGRFDAAGDVKLVESGPVRKVIRARAELGQSTLEQRFILYDDVPWLDVEVRVDWREAQKMLKLAFIPAKPTQNVSVEVPGAVIERAADSDEHPLHRFITAGPLSLVAANWNAYDAGPEGLRVTALRSPVYSDHGFGRVPLHPGVTYAFTDQGQHVWRYRLMARWSQWQTRTAMLLHRPPLTYVLERPINEALEGVDAGNPFPDPPLIQPNNIVMSAIKPARDGNGVIVRFREVFGWPVRAEITMFGAHWEPHFKAWEFRSWQIADGKVTPVTFLEEEAQL